MSNAYQYCKSSIDPPGCFSAIRESKLEELFTTCRRTRYYGHRLKGVDIRNKRGAFPSELDWFSTSMKDWTKNVDDMVLSGGNVGMEVPGTFAERGRLFATWTEVAEATAFIEFMFRGVGVNETDRFINCYDFSYNGFGVVHQRVCERMGAFCLPAGKVEPVQIFSRVEPYDVTVLMGHASLLSQVTRIAEKEAHPDLKAIFMTSERLPNDVRAWMEGVWRCPVYMGFGVPGTYPAIAMESAKRDGYVLNDLSYLVEIFPLDREKGEVHVTPLDFRCQPVLRLATGVNARLLPAEKKGDCACGTLVDLEDVPGSLITVGDAYFDLESFFDVVFGEIPGVERSCERVWKDGVETISFNVKPSDREQFTRLLAEAEPSLAKNVKLGTLSIEFVE